MLPKTKLGAELFRNLNVVVGSEHKQGAQEQLTLTILSNELFTKSVEEKPLLHVFMFRKEQE
jgi:hypothetical protein